MAKVQVRVGMSGWTYPGWRGSFYPKGLKSVEELRYASDRVNSIEVNGTFYRNQTPKVFQSWYDQTPKDFQFSIKGSQFITHVLRLKGVDQALSNFFASGLLCLEKKLGPILWQFPPNMTFKDERFHEFLSLLPKNFTEASRIAKKHSDRYEGRVYTEVKENYPIRHAFEFRHPSFRDAKVIEMLNEHRAALVFAHAGKKNAPYMEDLTAGFVYARLHGEGSSFKKGYSKKKLEEWKEKIRFWKKGKQVSSADVVSVHQPESVKRDVFIYFDNEVKVTAPKNAVALLKLLKA